jgi:ABC-type transport system substrate-binding protein
METTRLGFAHVKLHTFKFIAQNWKKVFTSTEKISLVLIALLVVLTSTGWVYAAAQMKNYVPKDGGTYIEGVVANSVDSIDLGRLTKSGLTRIDEKGSVSPDLALSWEIAVDKLTYKFTLTDKVSSYEIADLLKNNPSYAYSSVAQAIDAKNLSLKLPSPNANFLTDLAQPVFPYGPYLVDKKTDNEVRLKRNSNYHLNKPYIDKFIVRIYPDKAALQKAADRNKITGALGLDKKPDDWQSNQITLGKKHYLFINSSKTNLKKTKTREALLNGQKPDGVTTLDILEVNGEQEDADFIALVAKLKAAGIDVKERKVSLKDALKEDLPKRNYDLLYILVAEGQTHDPYLFYHSSERSGAGQNFAELANADLDNLLDDHRAEIDPAKKATILESINKAVETEKVSVTYASLKSNYMVSPKLKGFSVSPTCSCESDRFAQVLSWHFYEKKVK